jgi:hypothetical protein
MQLQPESSKGLLTDSGRDLPLRTRQSLLMCGCAGIAILKDMRFKFGLTGGYITTGNLLASGSLPTLDGTAPMGDCSTCFVRH